MAGNSYYKEGNLTEQEVSKEIQICARIFCRNTLVMYAVCTKEGQSGFVLREKLDSLFDKYKIEMSDKSSIVRVNIEIDSNLKSEEYFVAGMFRRGINKEFKLTSENSDEAKRLFNSGYVFINGESDGSLYGIIAHKLDHMYNAKYANKIADNKVEKQLGYIKNGEYVAVIDKYLTGTDDIAFYVAVDDKNTKKFPIEYKSCTVLTPEDVSRLGFIPKVIETVNITTDNGCYADVRGAKRFDSNRDNKKTFLARTYNMTVDNKYIYFFATIDIVNKKCLGTINGASYGRYGDAVKQLGFKSALDVPLYTENRVVNEDVNKVILDDYEKYKKGEIKNSVFLYKKRELSITHKGEMLESKVNRDAERQARQAERQARQQEINKARKTDTSRQSLMGMFKR